MLRTFWALARSSALLTALRSTPSRCGCGAWHPPTTITSPTAAAPAPALALPRFALETMAIFSDAFNRLNQNRVARREKGGRRRRVGWPEHQRCISEWQDIR